MSTEDNKKIIEKTKDVLKDLGYDVKTGHIYEMYARMAGFKNWHVAKTKGIDFTEQLPTTRDVKSSEPSLNSVLNLISQTRVRTTVPENILKLSKLKSNLNIKEYEKMIDLGKFKNVFHYGIDLRSKQCITVNNLIDPGAVFCGAMGSGKSLSMRFSLATHMFSNSENTIYILFDPMTGMDDYKEFFDLGNVYPIINDSYKIIPLINWLHNEVMERKKEFSKHNVFNFSEYNKLMKSMGQKELPELVLAMEQFHSIISSMYLNFELVDSLGSTANKLKDLMRIGRSYGVTTLIATQRATYDDFPSSLKAGLSKLMAFRVNNIMDASGLNTPQSADIPVGFHGLCATSHDGFIQFPYLGDDDIKRLLVKYYKPLKSQCLTEGLDKI